MTDGTEQALAALARLIDAGAKALESYVKLQEKRQEYFENAAKQLPTEKPEPPFEQFEPGYFERKFGKGAE
jgi:hypothetical protein